jgi:lipid-A-disaccharide synthase-like uncharacterized protein
MDWLRDLFLINNEFLGVTWNTWKIVGMAGNAIFLSRFLVQWYATERQRQVVVPAAFWWLSLLGSAILLAYAVFYRRDSVFVLAYAFNWIPYIRNLVIHHRTARSSIPCPACQTLAGSDAKFCSRCGAALDPVDSRTSSGKK